MASKKPHAIIVPFPAQGHITPALQLANFLHRVKSFHITFVLTDFNHRRLLRSRGPDAVNGLDDFRFETIPDGLPDSDHDGTQNIRDLCSSVRANCLGPFKELVARLNRDRAVPEVSCIVADGAMAFAIDAGEEIGVPVMLFFTHSGCGFWGYFHFDELVRRGYTPVKDENYLTNGYMDTPITFIPGLNNIRFRDLPTFVRTSDPNDPMIQIMILRRTLDIPRASGVIINTFHDLEAPVLAAARTHIENLYAVGPLCALSPPSPITTNLWKEDDRCVEWLDRQPVDRSVLYVNFGSIAVATRDQVAELAWGLVRSECKFLWVLRPDMVLRDSEFVEAAKGRGLVVGWCDQGRVLGHRAVGVFLSHCGWNSTLESVCQGVPIICWPFFAEQQMNCRHLCGDWGVGVEIEGELRREKVETLVREAMGGEKGKEMRRRMLELKEKARRATAIGGSSSADMERLVNDLLMGKRV